MDGIKITNIENKVLQLGDCEYEGGSFTIAAGGKHTAGTLLKRGDGESFVVADTVDNVIAVLPCDIENTSQTAKTTSIRALVWGRVRLDVLHYEATPGTPLTAVQRDALRSYGIVGRKVANWAQLDNQ